MNGSINGSPHPRHSTPISDNEERDSLVNLPSDLEDSQSEKRTVNDSTEDSENTEKRDESYTDFETTTESLSKLSLSSEDAELTAWHLWLLKKEQERRRRVPLFDQNKERAKDGVTNSRKKLEVLEEWVRRKDRERLEGKRMEEKRVGCEIQRERERQEEQFRRARDNFQAWQKKKLLEAQAKMKAQDEDEKFRQQILQARKNKNQIVFESWLWNKKATRSTVNKSSRPHPARRREIIVKLILNRDKSIQLRTVAS